MCGRFNLRSNPAAWTQEFLPLWSEEELVAAASEHAIAARYNIAPTQSVCCIHRVADQEKRAWSMMRWGLVPGWAKELSIGNRMINARSETAAEKNSFRSSFKKRRCLIPADGYYEWQKTPDGKQPYLIEHAGGKVLAMAGLWAVNHKVDPEGPPLETCTILTTSANETTRRIHDRMPVMLDENAQEVWMDQDIEDRDVLQSLMRPAPEDLLSVRPVSKIVNNARNDVPECVEPIELS